MIIHDENSETQPSSPTKAASSLLSSVVGVQRRDPSPGPAPPSYTVATSMTSTSEGPSSPLLPYQPGSSARVDRIHPQVMSQGYQDHTALALFEQRRQDISRRTRRRFCEALCIGILCYFLLMAFIGSTMQMGFRTPWNGMPPPNIPRVPHAPKPPSTPAAPSAPCPNPTEIDSPPGTPPQQSPWPGSGDGHIIQCSGADSWSPNPPSTPFIQTNLYDMTFSTGDKNEDLPYTAYNVFTLPVNATAKNIFSRGRHASGSMLLLTREADDNEDSIKVIMQASYRYREALDCNICELKKDNGARALGIYTSQDFDGSKDIRFTISVYFPRARSLTARPRDMGLFGAGLSWFDYSISTMDEVSFKDLTLATESDKMHSKGVVADVITLAANNGDITGKFNISEEANFATSNAKIDVDLSIFHVDEEGPSKGPKVTLSTNNAPILARNSLYHKAATSSHAPSTGGNFTIVGSTKNAHVNVSFATAPVDSLLQCVINTSNGDVDVHLHPTYEGDVTMVTTNGKTEVHQSDGIEDPSGRSRDRMVIWKHMWRMWMIGWVGWGERKQAGALVMNTSNGQNRLYL